MIPVEAIADVKARVDLVSFIEGQGIQLKRRGKAFLGLCPLHNDKSPSLSVDPVKQYWCCLGACSAGGKVLGGDVIELARRLWNVGLSEAIERLGGRTTVTLTSRRNGTRPPLRVVPRSSSPRPLSADTLLTHLAGFFHQGFIGSPPARAYIGSRGLTDPALLAALPIGFSDGSLLERAPEGSETYEALELLGVIGRDGGEHFAGCVVVPLRDLAGQVVGFYGRSIKGQRKVFLPGPRRGLVNAASAATTDELVFTEGIFDALACLQAGIPNAVPLYGTNGYTPDHDALLEKHRIRRVILALDGDEAGRTAARALGNKLSTRGIEVLDVVLPAHDPNQLLIAEGPEGFAKTWASALAEASRKYTGKGTGAGAASAAPHLVAPVPSLESEPSAKAGIDEPAAKEEKHSGSVVGLPVRSVPASAPVALTSEAAAPTLAATSLMRVLARDSGGVLSLAFGPRVFRVKGLTAHGVDRLRVNVRVDEGGHFHVDTFDLYSSRSRHAFIETAVKALRLPEEEDAILGDELAALIDALEKERLALRTGETKAEVQAAMSETQRAEAMAFLTGDIRAALRADFVSAGLVGEETSMLIGYYSLVSRKLDEPLSVLFCARSGAGKSTLQDRLCDFCPSEDLIKYTRISGQVLFYKDEDALEHKLLAVDEEDGASQAAYALRSLLSSGYLSCSVTRTDPQTGRQVDDDRRVNGPTSVFLTSAHPEAFDYETRNRYVLVTVDESRAQTMKILERQRWNETVDGLIARERRKTVYRKHHDAQRLLQPLDVVIPFEVSFPTSHLILRREQKKYLSLIKAITLLHQYQRPKKSVAVDGQTVEYIEAAEADLALAKELGAVILLRNLDELAPPTRSLLLVMRDLVREKRKAIEKAEAEEKAKAEEEGAGRGESAAKRYVLRRPRETERDDRLLLDRKEIQRAAGLSPWHIKTYLEQLVAFEYVALVAGRKGKTCLYELLWAGDDEDEPVLL